MEQVMLETIRETLFAETYTAREVLRERKEKYGEWSREYDLAYQRFSALYTVIECSGCEEDYQEWKKNRSTGGEAA